jgi:hypothetical protein
LQTSARQSYGNVLVRTIAMNLAAEETELYSLYERLGEKGKEPLALAKFQCKQIKEGMYNYIYAHIRPDLYMHWSLPLMANISMLALSDANGLIVSQAKYDDTLERLYNSYANHYRQIFDSDIPLLCSVTSKDECARIASQIETTRVRH